MLNKTISNPVISIILFQPGIFTYSPLSNIEVLPGLFSPIFINLKLTISNPSNRKVLVDALVKKIRNKKVNYICGIESGGSYFASSVADKLNLPLILLRKSTKDHGDFQIIVGEKPKKNSRVMIIDDVLATGSSLKKAKLILNNFGANCSATVIFSYGYQKFIGHKIGLDIFSTSNFNRLQKVANKANILNKDDTILLKKHLLKYKNLV